MEEARLFHRRCKVNSENRVAIAAASSAPSVDEWRTVGLHCSNNYHLHWAASTTRCSHDRKIGGVRSACPPDYEPRARECIPQRLLMGKKFLRDPPRVSPVRLWSQGALSHHDRYPSFGAQCRSGNRELRTWNSEPELRTLNPNLEP